MSKMESNRQKYYKRKIERMCGDNENETTPLQPHTNRRSSVTLLDSLSYHNQNKDLLNFDEPERITNDREKQNGKNNPDTVQSEEILEGCNKADNFVNVITIEFEQLKDDDNKENRSDDIMSKIDKGFIMARNENVNGDDEILIHVERDEDDENKENKSNNMSEMEKGFIMARHENVHGDDEMLVHVERDEYENEFLLIETDDNMKTKNKNSKESEEKYEQNSKNPDNIHRVMVHMPQDTIIEISNSNRTDSNESLHPTLTEIIPETEMDIIRKSLEDDNAGDVDISNQPGDAPKKGRKSKRTVIKKSYLDFMGEDEDFAWDSTSWKDTDDSSSNEEDLPKKKKTVNAEDGKVGEKGLKKKEENKAKKRKDARSKGEVYQKKDGSIRKERQLQPNPCIGKKCPWKCAEIDTEKRIGIFNYFWGLSNQRKKEWLIAMSSRQEVKRKRSKNSNYRTNTFNYFINDGEGRRQVCSKFLISTLDVTQRYIYYTLANISQGISKEDGRGRCVPANS